MANRYNDFSGSGTERGRKFSLILEDKMLVEMTSKKPIFYKPYEIGFNTLLFTEANTDRLAKALAQILFLASTADGAGAEVLEAKIPEDRKLLCREWGASSIISPKIGYRIPRQVLLSHGNELIDFLQNRSDFPDLLERTFCHSLISEQLPKPEKGKNYANQLCKLIPQGLSIPYKSIQITAEMILNYGRTAEKEPRDWQKGVGIRSALVENYEAHCHKPTEHTPAMRKIALLGNGAFPPDVSFTDYERPAKPSPAPQNSPNTSQPGPERLRR